MLRSSAIYMIITAILYFAMMSWLSKATAKTVDCRAHPIYCQIKKNKPKIDRDYAMKLSDIVYRITRKYHIPPRIFVAILAQESGYQLGAKGCHTGLRDITLKEFESEVNKCTNMAYSFVRKEVTPNPYVNNEDCLSRIKRTVETKVCSDFGIGQIYFRTAEGFKLNVGRLIDDLEYSVEAAAIVLADFKKRYERREVDWWTRYNARSDIKRGIYKALVKRYL